MKRLLIFLLVLCAIPVMAQDFNVSEALEGHVRRLCDQSYGGRMAGTQGEAEAAGYVYDYFKKNGVVMLSGREGQEFAMATGSDTLISRNIVGLVEGSDPQLKDEYIVVGANFDNLGFNVVDHNGKQELQYYSGADANASGTAVLMELAKLVALHSYMFPRTIVFVGFGASERGFAGSWYFVNRSFENLSSVRTMVNLNMLGRGKDGKFSVFSQMPLKNFMGILDATREEPVVIVPSSTPKEIVPSDHLPFYEKNIPIVSFTTGMTREYHTLKDTPEMLSYYDMELECNYLFYFLKTLSSSEDIPTLNAPTVKTPTDKKGEKLYTLGELDKRPEFFHSDEKHFLEYWVYKYLKYPQAALANGIQGKVIVSFIIEKNGQVTNVEVINGIDDDLDAEALRVVSVSPKWSAGQVKGEKVRTRMTIPVEFRLTTAAPKFKIKR